MTPRQRIGGAANGGPPDPASITDARRVQILRAAARVIGERGFGDTRITDVSRAAGVSSALVIYYFGTRDRLLTEALRYSEDVFYETISERLSALPTAASRLEEIVRLSCEPSGQNGMPGSWVLWLDLWAQAVRHPEVSRDREELDQRWRRTVSTVVQEGLEGGEFQPVDVEEFALMLTALLDGLAVQVTLRDPVVHPEQAFAVAMTVCRNRLGPAWEDAPLRVLPRPAAGPPGRRPRSVGE